MTSELKKRDEEIAGLQGNFKLGGVNSIKKALLSGAFYQACTMTFLAEWGDRSQIATIVLGAREVICDAMRSSNNLLLMFISGPHRRDAGRIYRPRHVHGSGCR